MLSHHKLKQYEGGKLHILAILSELTFTRVTRRNSAGPPGLLTVPRTTPIAVVTTRVMFTLTLEFLGSKEYKIASENLPVCFS